MMDASSTNASSYYTVYSFSGTRIGTAATLDHFQGFFVDAMRAMQDIALEMDNITLTYDLFEGRPFSHVYVLDNLANDCHDHNNNNNNNSDNSNKTFLEDENGTRFDLTVEETNCTRFDLAVTDIFAWPERPSRVLLSPPLLNTALSALKYVHRKASPQVETLAQAMAVQERVCLMNTTYAEMLTTLKYPTLKVQTCDYREGVTGCLRMLKTEQCSLYVDEDLILRGTVVEDADFAMASEHFSDMFIVWPISSRLEPRKQQLLLKWIYQAKWNGVLDQLYDKYFSVAYCPIGRAGATCDMPCSPSHGIADRHGTCICHSTKWTGSDCSIEVQQDLNMIPTSLKTICYVMVGINGLAVLICSIWIALHRGAPQVQVAQPLFLGLVLLGCLISTSTIIAMSQEDEADGPVHGCLAIPWLYSIGFSITFGSLFAKIRRAYMVVNAATQMRRVTVTSRETALIVGVVVSIDVAILTVWTIVDPLVWERIVLTKDKFGEPLSSHGFCTSEYWEVFASIIGVWHFVLLGIASAMCYVARKIPTAFSEGKYVMLAMVSNLQIFVVGVPILILLGPDSQTSFFVRSVSIWMNDFVVLVFIFGNLIYMVHFNRVTRDMDSSQLMRHASQEIKKGGMRDASESNHDRSMQGSFRGASTRSLPAYLATRTRQEEENKEEKAQLKKPNIPPDQSSDEASFLADSQPEPGVVSHQRRPGISLQDFASHSLNDNENSRDSESNKEETLDPVSSTEELDPVSSTEELPAGEDTGEMVGASDEPSTNRPPSLPRKRRISFQPVTRQSIHEYDDIMGILESKEIKELAIDDDDDEEGQGEAVTETSFDEPSLPPQPRNATVETAEEHADEQDQAETSAMNDPTAPTELRGRRKSFKQLIRHSIYEHKDSDGKSSDSGPSILLNGDALLVERIGTESTQPRRRRKSFKQLIQNSIQNNSQEVSGPRTSEVDNQRSEDDENQTETDAAASRSRRRKSYNELIAHSLQEIQEAKAYSPEEDARGVRRRRKSYMPVQQSGRRQEPTSRGQPEPNLRRDNPRVTALAGTRNKSSLSQKVPQLERRYSY